MKDDEIMLMVSQRKIMYGINHQLLWDKYVYYLDIYKDDMDYKQQSGPQHQSSGEDQIVGVEDRGGTAGKGGRARTSRERGRWQLGFWSLPRRR